MKWGALIGLVLLSGCAAMDRNYPLEDFYRAAYLARAQVRGIPDDGAMSLEERNQRINEALWLVDQDFAQYEASLYVSAAAASTIADVATMAAAGAATVAGGEGIKTALAAVATGIAGTRAAVDRAFYAEQSRTALIATMRAQRANRLVEIELGKRLPVFEYPWSEAMLDVQAYAHAGSIVSALEGITKDSTRSLAVAQERLENARRRRAPGPMD